MDLLDFEHTQSGGHWTDWSDDFTWLLELKNERKDVPAIAMDVMEFFIRCGVPRARERLCSCLTDSTGIQDSIRLRIAKCLAESSPLQDEFCRMYQSEESIEALHWHLSHGALDAHDETVSTSLCPVVMLWLHTSINSYRSAYVTGDLGKLIPRCMATLRLFKKKVLTETTLLCSGDSYTLSKIVGRLTAEKFPLQTRLDAAELLSSISDRNAAKSCLSGFLASRSIDARAKGLRMAMEIKRKDGPSSLAPSAHEIRECARCDWPFVMRLARAARAED